MADPGRLKSDEVDLVLDAYRNAPIQLESNRGIRENVHTIQTRYGLRPSDKLSIDMIAGREAYNFSIEMETGTGKTYTYIRTIIELNKRFMAGLSLLLSFPSVAIREGVLKVSTDHVKSLSDGVWQEPRYFVYDSSRLGDLDSLPIRQTFKSWSSTLKPLMQKAKMRDGFISEQESFRWRRPIDVLAAMNPIMIIDEPQSVEGKQTKGKTKKILSHCLHYVIRLPIKKSMIWFYRLDAMDAYNQKLVKKIAVKAIEQTGTTGTQGYLYLQEIIPTKTGKHPKPKLSLK